MHYFILAILSLCLLLSACTFDPEIENFIALSSEPSVQVDNISLSAVSDTFRIFARNTRLDFDVAVENEDTVIVIIYVDNREYKKVYAQSGTFVLRANNYKEGYHSLRLEAITDSGTGSLADKLGTENLIWSKEWTFILNFDPPEPVNIVSTYPEDGRLAIEWEKSDVSTEKLLVITPTRTYGGSKLFGDPWSYTISDANQTRLVDTVYVGGSVNISLTAIATNPDDTSPVTSYAIDYLPPKIIKQAADEYGHVTITWNKPIFYRNFGKYIIDYIDYEKETAFETALVEDTSAVINIPFGETSYLRLSTISQYQKDEYSKVYTIADTQVYVGEKHQWIMSNAVHASLNPQYGFQTDLNSNAILEKDSIVKKLNSNIWRQYAISSRGNYLYFPNLGKISRFDREGNIETVLDTEEVYGKKITARSLSIGNDRYLCFANKLSASAVYIYDIVEKKTVSELTLGGYEELHATRQTPDGKYLAIQYTFRTELYTLLNGVIQQTKIFKDVTNAAFFDTAHKNHLIMLHQDNVEMYDMTSGKSTIHPVDATYFQNATYDPITGYIGGEQTDHYVVIDPATGSVLRDILARAYTYAFSLYNGHLYAFKYKLDLKLD